MPMFGGKHFSNPKVGMMHGEPDGDEQMSMSESEPKGVAKSYHVHHHDDGTAHSHIHHADDTHEHTDHASPEEAHAHVEKATGAGDSNEGESEDETMQPMAKTFKPSAVRHADNGAF